MKTESMASFDLNTSRIKKVRSIKASKKGKVKPKNEINQELVGFTYGARQESR
jgi:hypothetical protein